MGLDINIYDSNDPKNQVEIGYFRKFYQLKNYWEDFARKNYPELAEKMPEEDGFKWAEGMKEYWEKKYAQGYYNCVPIPIREKDWRDCLEYFSGNLFKLVEAKEDPMNFHEMQELFETANKIERDEYFKNQEFLYFVYWE